MKLWILATAIAVAILTNGHLFAGDHEPVTVVVEMISAAVDDSLARWLYTEEDGESAAWEEVTLRRGTRARKCRFKAELTIPEIFAGTPVSGGAALLHLSFSGPVDHEIVVMVNGEEAARMPEVDPETRLMEYPPVELATEAKPGDTYVVEVVVTNPGIYPPHEFLDASRTVYFRSASLELTAASEMRDRLRELSINLETGDAMLRPWEPTGYLADRVWLVEVDRSKIEAEERSGLRETLNDAAALLDIHALAAGKTADLGDSLQRVYDALQPVGEFSKRFTIHAVANAHIDLAWLWRTRETEAISANTFRSVLANMTDYPDLVYAQSQAQTYAWVEKNEPDLFRRIKESEKAGNWEVAGGMWAEPDCNIPGGESWVRQFLLAQNYFLDRFGKTTWLGWNPDSFGYNWNMPQLYSKAGIRAFITQKISWNDTTVFPYHLFWWESPDGSRILTYFPTGSYTEQLQPDRLVDQLMRFERNTGIDEILVLYGVGNHGGGPNRVMLERARMLQRQPVFPNLVFGRARDFMTRLMERDLESIPVWRDELYLEGHRGTLTTQARTKLGNRRGEALLETAEKAAWISGLSGSAYPSGELARAWKLVLLNQFHDILPGSSITPVFRDAESDYDLVRKLTGRVIDRSLAAIATGIATPEEDWRTVLVFNPLSWQRGGVVRVPLPEDAPPELAVLDGEGDILPGAIITSEDGLDRTLVFQAVDVPSVGYSTFHVRIGGRRAKTDLTHDGLTMENAHLRVSVSEESGNITSIFDKTNGRELLAEGQSGNVIQLHENLPSYWDAWNIGYTERDWRLDSCDSVELIDRSPLALTIRVEKSFLGLSKANRAPTEGFPSSFFTQEITLNNGSPQLDLSLKVDWWEDHTLLKVAFPFAVESDTATYEIPFASIERSTRRESPAEKARFEVAVHRWADLGEDGYGVSLLNDSKYGMDTHGSMMRLTGLTSPLWPDPMADRGKQEMAYAVYPHAGSWKEGRTVHLAREMNLPLVARVMKKGGGESEPSRSFFTVDGEGVILETIKPSENGDGLILRLVEQFGNSVDATVTLPAAVASAEEIDLLERKIGKARYRGDRIRFRISPHEVKSFMVKLK